MAKTPEDRQNPANEMMENLIERGILVPEPTRPAPIAAQTEKCAECGKTDSDGDHKRVGVRYTVGDGFHKYAAAPAKQIDRFSLPSEVTLLSLADQIEAASGHYLNQAAANAIRLLLKERVPFCRKLAAQPLSSLPPEKMTAHSGSVNAIAVQTEPEEDGWPCIAFEGERCHTLKCKPKPIAAQPENPQVVTTYGVYLSVERYNRLIEYENNTKTHIKNRSILLNHAADLHEDLSKIAELVGIAKSGDLFNMSELIDAVRKLVVPANA